MQIEQIRLEDIEEYERNPRNNDGSVEKTAHAINEFGFLVPIILGPDNTIIDGHLRYKAACLLKMESVPCVRADGLDATQLKALRLSVNRIAQDAGWDWALLKLEVAEIVGDGYDIEMTGFENDEITALLDQLADEPDFEPELEPTTSTASVNDNDVTNAEEKLNDRFKDAGADNYKGILCPHCGQEFWLE